MSTSTRKPVRGRPWPDPPRTEGATPVNCYVMSPQLRALITIIADEFGGKPAAFAARPYLDALLDLEDGVAAYGHDDVHGMLIRLRGNIRGWQGSTARVTKAALDRLLAGGK